MANCRMWPITMFPEAPGIIHWPVGMWPICFIADVGGSQYIVVFNDVNLINIVPINIDIMSLMADNDVDLINIMPMTADEDSIFETSSDIVKIKPINISITSSVFDTLNLEKYTVVVGDFIVNMPENIDILTIKSILSEIVKIKNFDEINIINNKPISGVIN